jgi:hypothetical protein
MVSAKAYRYLALCLLGALWPAAPAFAQFETATVLGTVRDPVAASVAGAAGQRAPRRHNARYR